MKRFNADSIRIIREAKNMTRDDLAAAIGGNATRMHVHGWETGKHVPSAEYLAAIVNAFNLKSTDIFFTNSD